MPTNVAEMAPEQGKIIKITLSDVSEEKPIPTAVQNRYGRSEFGGYLGNVGLTALPLGHAARHLLQPRPPSSQALGCALGNECALHHYGALWQMWFDRPAPMRQMVLGELHHDN